MEGSLGIEHVGQRQQVLLARAATVMEDEKAVGFAGRRTFFEVEHCLIGGR
jgi:hypothetical protein